MSLSIFLERCTFLLNMLSDTANGFINWLFVEIPIGPLGTTMPIYLVSFSVIQAYLLWRVIANMISE